MDLILTETIMPGIYVHLSSLIMGLILVLIAMLYPPYKELDLRLKVNLICMCVLAIFMVTIGFFAILIDLM